MIRLCKTKATQPLTTGQFRKELSALILAAILVNREHHQGPLYRSSGAHTTVAPFKLLHHQSVTYIIKSTAAVFNRNSGSETTEITKLLYNLLGEFRLLRIVLNYRRDFLLHITSDRVP